MTEGDIRCPPSPVLIRPHDEQPPASLDLRGTLHPSRDSQKAHPFFRILIPIFRQATSPWGGTPGGSATGVVLSKFTETRPWDYSTTPFEDSGRATPRDEQVASTSLAKLSPVGGGRHLLGVTEDLAEILGFRESASNGDGSDG